ncbi:MAG: SDR family oxidoreductase [Acidobacteria bacterium]|nr:SDR family oxidoreductase [Acidobacteriota bacterium]
MNVTLITGASSGIGEEFARRLAAEGRDLVLVARSERALHELCDELMLKHKIMAHYIVTDLTGAESDAVVFEETTKHGFEVDWLINNAGYGAYGDFSNVDLDKQKGMIDLNIRSLIALTHRYLPSMRERRRGTIINVSSAAGFQPLPYMAVYAATKSFVTAFSEAIAEENREYGVQIMALCPGSTKTNFFKAASMDNPIHAKGQQTVDEVVDTALRGVRQGRTRIISGLTNHITAMAVTFVPNKLITRLMARALGPRYRNNK